MAIRALRIHRGVIQTPMVAYRNGDRTLTVVATCHVGTSGYYKSLQDAIAGLESQGASVLYEETVSAPEEQWATAADEERHARDIMTSDGDRQRRDSELATKSLGWSTQADLAYCPSWRNEDMTDLEVIRRAGADVVIAALGHRGGPSSDQAGDRARAARFANLMVLMLRVEAVWPALARRIVAAAESDAGRVLARVIGHDREARAISAVPQDGDAVLVWGYGHLAGFDSALRSAGFSLAVETWLNVGKIPSMRRRSS